MAGRFAPLPKSACPPTKSRILNIVEKSEADKADAAPAAMFTDHSQLSPHFATDDILKDPSLVRKADVLEDQVQFWLLNPADALLATAHGERAALTLGSAYFELIACYLAGAESDGHSRPFFRRGLLEVFPEIADSPKQTARWLSEVAGHCEGDEIVERIVKEISGSLYRDLRCGLVHIGLLRPRILLTSGIACNSIMDSESWTVTSILIDPYLFLDRIRQHFRSYITALRQGTGDSLQINFERLWDARFLSRR